MPEKPKSSKKKVNSPASRAASVARGAKVKPGARQVAYYVTGSMPRVIVSDRKPAGSAEARRFATFEEARRAAIEALVAAIEDAEKQLLALKRAKHYDELGAARVV